MGPMGVNIVEVVKAINEKTRMFEGMKVPVTLTVDAKTKGFTIAVGTPPTSALILKEIKAEKGAGDTPRTRVGNLTMVQVKKIVEAKGDSLGGKAMRQRAREVVGTCVSLGVTVEGKLPKEIQTEIAEGKWDKAWAR